MTYSLKALVLKTTWSARTQVKLKTAYFEGREIRSDMPDLCSLNVLPAAAGLSQSHETLHFTTVRHNLDGDKWVSITAQVRSSLSEMKCDGDTGFTISENLETSTGMSSLIDSSPLPHSVWRKSVNLLSNRDSHVTTKWLMCHSEQFTLRYRNQLKLSNNKKPKGLWFKCEPDLKGKQHLYICTDFL